MNILKAILSWILGLFGGEPKAIKVSGKLLFMPLFMPDSDGKTLSTWPYLSMPYGQQKRVRGRIKGMAKFVEQPAIALLLNPNNEAGHIWNEFPNVHKENLATAAQALRELVEDGIAVFATLYNDDPSGSMPRWWEIEKYPAAWSEINKAIGSYVTGYILSIETNERCESVGQLQHCIYLMSIAMPGVELYGTHLQWKAAGAGYRWCDKGSTPYNAQIILAENSWQPQRGDAAGLAGVQREYGEIARAVDMGKVVMHEYGLNMSGKVFQTQRDWLRDQNVKGIG